jgi:predicted type IV restriction endonuclease
MAISCADAKIEVEGLVERFARNLDVYKRADYKETQVRIEFIDPFFEALGWDVRNVQGYAEQYKDVIHEDAIKVSGATRAPDYCFRIGGVRKFFLEAKKPSISVKGDVGPAYQLRRYAWSAKLPLSILTDFEEFSVYDCRQRPKPADKASAGRVMYLTFDQYLDRFDDIYSVFAKESVLRGSFDRYVQDTKRKRGTSEVDAEFLREIEGWRDALARNIALRNPAVSVPELNFAVQRTIDRIIFLRMCEDRGIEDYARLLALTSGPHIYERLGDLYRQADEKYNAGLFDFRADTLTKTLTIDDKVLKPILAGMY